MPSDPGSLGEPSSTLAAGRVPRLGPRLVAPIAVLLVGVGVWTAVDPSSGSWTHRPDVGEPRAGRGTQPGSAAAMMGCVRFGTKNDLLSWAFSGCVGSRGTRVARPRAQGAAGDARRPAAPALQRARPRLRARTRCRGDGEVMTPASSGRRESSRARARSRPAGTSRAPGLSRAFTSASITRWQTGQIDLVTSRKTSSRSVLRRRA